MITGASTNSDRLAVRPLLANLSGALFPDSTPEIIGLRHMGSIGDAYGEGTFCLDVFYGLMGFGKVKGHIAPFLHGAQAAFMTFTLPSSL